MDHLLEIDKGRAHGRFVLETVVGPVPHRSVFFLPAQEDRLKELGYYKGSVDGSYGAGTVSAVKAFQSANNLTSDGVAGSKTQETMYTYYAVAKKSSGSSSGRSASRTGKAQEC